MSGRDENLMRNLGKFVGAVWHGVKTPAREPRVEVRRSKEETTAEHEGRRVIVRRTIIEEIETPDSRRSGAGDR